jgi:hypothetical protein
MKHEDVALLAISHGEGRYKKRRREANPAVAEKNRLTTLGGIAKGLLYEPARPRSDRIVPTSRR